MANNWAEWDKEHGKGGGGLSSAEKIAAQIRGVGGNAHSHPAPVHGAHGSTVRQVTKKDLKRPAPVKGEKDRADSMRTQIRMAEYNRKKAAAVKSDPVDKTTPRVEQKANPHEPKPPGSADRAASGVTDQRRATHYGMVAGRAQLASESAKTASEHRTAAKAHERAAELAPNAAQRMAHQKLAANHTQSAAVEDRAEAAAAAKRDAAEKAARVRAEASAKETQDARQRLAQRQADNLANLSDRASGASAKAERENTKENHQAASDLHQKAADVARQMGRADLASHHQNLAGMHQMAADGPRKRTGRAGDRSMEKSSRSADKIAATVVPESPTHTGLYHASGSPQAIRQHGFRTGEGENGAFFGKGVYFHTKQSDAEQSLAGYRSFINPAMEHVRAEATVKNPFVVKATAQDYSPGDVMQRAMVNAGYAKRGENLSPGQITSRLQSKGHDGVEVRQSGFNHDIAGSQLVVFDPKNARIVK